MSEALDLYSKEKCPACHGERMAYVPVKIIVSVQNRG